MVRTATPVKLDSSMSTTAMALPPLFRPGAPCRRRRKEILPTTAAGGVSIQSGGTLPSNGATWRGLAIMTMASMAISWGICVASELS